MNQVQKKVLGLSIPVWVLLIYMVGVLTGAWATERVWSRTHVCFICGESTITGELVVHEACIKTELPSPEFRDPMEGLGPDGMMLPDKEDGAF